MGNSYGTEPSDWSRRPPSRLAGYAAPGTSSSRWSLASFCLISLAFATSRSAIRARSIVALFSDLGTRLTDENFVAAFADGSPMQPTVITHEWVRVIRATSLPRVRFHDLRHAHATHMLSSGIHPKVASERLGHSKVGITLDLYSHVLPGMQEDAAAKMDVALKAAQKRN